MAMRKIITIDDLIEILAMQVANLAFYKNEVAATAQDQADVPAEHDNLVLIRDYSDLTDGNKKAVTKTKQGMFDGDPGEPISPLPTFTAVSLSNPVSGSKTLTIKRNKRFMLGPLYTAEIGQALGIESVETENVVPANLKPSIDLFPAANNHHFSIVVTGRGDAVMWDVYIMRKGGEWTKVDSCQGKSADVSVSLQTAGDAEQIQVRIQLRKNNADYGQVSEPAYVTLNP